MSLIVDTKVLENKSLLLDEQVDLIYNKINNIQGIVDHIVDDVWTSVDNKIFNAKMDSYIVELKNLANSMQSYSDFIKNYNKEIEKADQKDRDLIIV